MKIKRFSILLLALLVLLSACGNKGPAETESAWTRKKGDIHTELQARYLAGPYDKIGRYASGKEELSRPQGVKVDFYEQKLRGTHFYVQYSTDWHYNGYEIVETDTTDVVLPNLKVGTIYYWRVSATEEGLSDAVPHSFTTYSAAPRNLEIDGVTNVRDLGGWKSERGYVKQGMLIRGGRLNADNEAIPAAEITEAGMKTFTESLKIRTELDLRRASDNEIGGLTESVVPGVRYVNVEMDSGGSPENNKEQIRAIFELLSDRENYPIYFHCSIGTDRTGLVAYLILGLLGVAREDLYRDYAFSNFASIGSARQISTLETNVAGKLDKYEGATLSEKITNFLLGCGVTPEQIASVKDILYAP